MRYLFLAAPVFAFALTSSAAIAETAPGFLANGQKYTTGNTSCDVQAGLLETPVYILASDGIGGYEFGCSFVDFHSVEHNETADGFEEVLAIAACGDDSGINRGNTFHIIKSDKGTLRVTSQNDYLLSFVTSKNSDGADSDVDDPWSLVDREFVPCD